MDVAEFAPVLAQYNQDMNRRILEATAALPAERHWADLGAFFKSIMGTLNHLYVTDVIWLQRLSAFPHPFPELADVVALDTGEWSYGTVLFERLEDLSPARAELDEAMVAWSHRLAGLNLNQPLAYRNMRGHPFSRPMGAVTLQMFTHQIHHRGQLTTLLMQEGQTIDGTGFLPFVSDSDTGG